MTNNSTIFVTGGTGKQGGAVARNLSQQGFNVKVLTRNPDAPIAQKLKALNIQLIKGDLDRPDTYRAHLKDVQGIFSVQTFENGVSKEIEQGLALASTAKEAGIRHFIYSSVAGAALSSGVPHFESKFHIENHIQRIGLPFTIIRPASLYENFLIPQVKKPLLKGKLVQPINRDTVLQYTAAEDIGKAAVQVFKNPETYLGKILPLATEQMNTQQVADTFSTVLKQAIEYKKLPTIIVRLFFPKTLYKMFHWLNEENRSSTADLQASKKEFPFLLSLQDWNKNAFPSLIS